MDKQAQVLIIFLWILIVLVILVASIGQSASVTLKFSVYQKNRQRALYLSKAGINRAIAEIKNDDPGYDTLNDTWANNKNIFEKISLNDNEDEFATVSYSIKENNQEETVFGVIDEERKININTAPRELLVELFNKIGAGNPSELANNICAWRGDTGVTLPDYSERGYSNKADKFINREELILVKGIDNEIYNKIRDVISVWGNGKANINTASEDTLDILIEYCRKCITEENDPQNLVERIIQLRLNKAAFKSFAELQTRLKEQTDLNTGQINILNELPAVADFKSTCFYITSNGKIKKNGRARVINCVFDRDKQDIIYWHER